MRARPARRRWNQVCLCFGASGAGSGAWRRWRSLWGGLGAPHRRSSTKVPDLPSLPSPPLSCRTSPPQGEIVSIAVSFEDTSTSAFWACSGSANLFSLTGFQAADSGETAVSTDSLASCSCSCGAALSKRSPPCGEMSRRDRGGSTGSANSDTSGTSATGASSGAADSSTDLTSSGACSSTGFSRPKVKTFLMKLSAMKIP